MSTGPDSQPGQTTAAPPEEASGGSSSSSSSSSSVPQTSEGRQRRKFQETLPAAAAASTETAARPPDAAPAAAAASTEDHRRFTEAPAAGSQRKRSRWGQMPEEAAGGESGSSAAAPSTSPLPSASPLYAGAAYLPPSTKPMQDPKLLLKEMEQEHWNVLAKALENSDDPQLLLETGEGLEGISKTHMERAKEMLKTSGLAATITALNKEKGKSLQEYVPSDILQAFESKYEAIKKGDVDSRNREVVVTQGAQISESNKGFQLLKKAGWTEGRGLGAEGKGIQAPVRAAAETVIGESRQTHEPSARDDPFEQFRKRNMLAYRFRPNPLNNPRRGYDGYATIYDKESMDTILTQLAPGEEPPGPQQQQQHQDPFQRR
uniref:G-patch domain-containing protein n=1 Tax=Chromera velia CCMP2878 TaxID=1169474 RepID=A0A0G4I0Z4_9ALVE|mmetsp:Transcript_51395/g.100903  ORF Transcript_51395/g.100903 Transcript_51395/m.100903 type:complete len:376 (-) Transcript_51395:219-1346(-)|eukprot:Cvel_10045.t1-p1 / transcript=Cvel_10045.t1 / gene=Cvel_10045 / organism=Chromera_velia_CCMP2878 / gene_product=SURP and G-patch domain-containing protein 1, putative / transcript_product=SURP and G-patch domain-containing protein 1, putative / location=Cvel_scaffold597:61322-62446(-) / protein_length=375 / sequence_SO=supercontig / SO=protein_coding / is_pseudo=false